MKKLFLVFSMSVVVWPYAGVSSLEFLNIESGAASVAMGGASAAADATLEGMYNNPASISLLPAMLNASMSYALHYSAMPWSCAFGFRFEKGIALALAGKGIIYDPIGAGIPYETGYSTNYNAMDLAVNAGLGVPLGDMLDLPIGVNLGCTAGYAYENLDDVNISAVVISCGITTSFFNDMLGFGFAARNIGFAGSAYQRIEMPVELIFGTRFQYGFSDSFKLLLLADTDLASIAGAAASARIGAEARLMRIFTVRLGGRFGDHVADFSAGGGVVVPIGGSMFRVEYALASAPDVGIRHIFQIVYSSDNFKAVTNVQ